jgi:hypothetical protein
MDLRPLPPAARRAAVAGALAVAVASFAPRPVAAAPQAQTAADAAKARELHAKGKQAYQAGDVRGAYEAYSAAWALTKTFDIAANLGAVELATARFRDAAEHLTYALAHLPISGDGDKQRPALIKLLEDAKKQIGTLTIKVSVDRAAVTLDGRALGESPLPDEIFVDPGDHVIAATAPTFAPAEQKLNVMKGASIPVVITLKPVEVAPPPVTPPAGPSPITVAGFITAGLGLGVGTALAIVSKIKSDDAGTQLAALESKGPNACAGAAPSPACVALHDARAGRDTFANAALWTFVGAGVVTAGTLVYTFAIPRSPAAKPAAISAVPVVTPGGGGLLVSGAF